MVNIRWDSSNWITVLLMVGIAYAAVGLVRSFIIGSLPDASA